MASGQGAVRGVVDAVSCGGGNRGGSDAELAVQGLALSGGALMFGADAAVGVPDDLSQPLLTPASTLTRATNRGA
jgi:hypothetical protein